MYIHVLACRRACGIWKSILRRLRKVARSPLGGMFAGFRKGRLDADTLFGLAEPSKSLEKTKNIGDLSFIAKPKQAVKQLLFLLQMWADKLTQNGESRFRALAEFVPSVVRIARCYLEQWADGSKSNSRLDGTSRRENVCRFGTGYKEMLATQGIRRRRVHCVWGKEIHLAKACPMFLGVDTPTR